MLALRRRALLLAAACTAPLAACTSPNPALYTLAPVPGVPRPGSPRVVLLHQIAVARYLERPDIVRSSENYRLDVMANDIWGEPLGSMIGRVLAEDLSQRMPNTTFININGAITAKEDASVEVNIQRMDMDVNRALAFVAQTAVQFMDPRRGEATRIVRSSIPVASSSTADEVHAMSIALARLADEIADMLRQPRGTAQRSG
jgi:uncharacterized protein